MAASTGQGRSFATFLVGLTVACTGIAYFSSGMGKLALLLGAFIACFGWILILFGLHLVTGTGGRIVLALVGIAVSLFGIIFVLPAAFNKNAIWKA